MFIAAHMKSSCRWVTSCSVYDLNSATRVISSIKAFIDGPVITLVLTSVLHNIISITKTKSSEKITHPIIMPIFNFCLLVEYLLSENLIYVYVKCTDMRFLMSSLIQKNSIAFSSSWCHMHFLSPTIWREVQLLYYFWPFLFDPTTLWYVQYNLESREFQSFVLMYWHTHCLSRISSSSSQWRRKRSYLLHWVRKLVQYIYIYIYIYHFYNFSGGIKDNQQ